MPLVYGGMGPVLGILGLLVFIVVVITLAATVTWAVVKLSPAKKQKPAEPAA